MEKGKECCCHKTKQRSEEEYKSLIHRLNRIEGQIRGIKGMVEKDVYCTDILVHWSIFWHIFFPNYCDFGAGNPEDEAKYCLDDPERADILCHRRKFAYDPFDQKNRNGQDQISDHHDTDENKSYHYLIPFRA